MYLKRPGRKRRTGTGDVRDPRTKGSGGWGKKKKKKKHRTRDGGGKKKE